MDKRCLVELKLRSANRCHTVTVELYTSAHKFHVIIHRLHAGHFGVSLISLNSVNSKEHAHARQRWDHKPFRPPISEWPSLSEQASLLTMSFKWKCSIKIERAHWGVNYSQSDLRLKACTGCTSQWERLGHAVLAQLCF